MLNTLSLKQHGINYNKCDLSSYPQVISRTLAAYMEHYKDEVALFWVSSENSFITDRFTDIMNSGLFSTKNARYIYYKTSSAINAGERIGGFYALMTREEILNVADKYKDLEKFNLHLSYNRGDKLLKYLDVRTYLQYINAKNSDYIPLRICHTKKLENEKSFDNVSWNEYLSSAESIIKMFPVSSIIKTVNGTISIDFLYREKVTKAENGGSGLKNGDISGFITGHAGLLYYEYDGTDYLYNNVSDTVKKAFSSKSRTEWFGYDQPSAAVRASVKKVRDNWNPGTVGFVFDSVIPEKKIEIYTVLSKAQITELLNSPDFTDGNLVVQTYYSAFDKSVIEKCIPEYKWVDQLIYDDMIIN
jgi:hypothetical protein